MNRCFTEADRTRLAIAVTQWWIWNSSKNPDVELIERLVNALIRGRGEEVNVVNTCPFHLYDDGVYVSRFYVRELEDYRPYEEDSYVRIFERDGSINVGLSIRLSHSIRVVIGAK